MDEALVLAREAATNGDVPVGAVVVVKGVVVARAGNRTERDRDPTAHAEMLALRAASRVLGSARMTEATMYVTLEPCAMCAGAIVQARVARVVFGAWDDKAGMAGSVFDLLRNPRLNHRCEVETGLRSDRSSSLLTSFFASKRGYAER